MSERSLANNCLTYLGQRWMTVILDALADGPKRYIQLERACEIRPNMLARVLKSLERDGLIGRFESPALRRQVEYELMPLGQSFREMASACNLWIAQHGQAIAEARGAFEVKESHMRRDENSLAGPEPGTPHRLTMGYISVVVEDIGEASHAYAEIFNVPTPRIIDGEVQLPNGVTIPVRICWVGFRNLTIGLVERTRKPSPYRAFAARRGPGIHHFGFDVPEALADYVRVFEANGGPCTLGGARNDYADFDFRHRLGTIVELLRLGHNSRVSAGVAALGGTQAITNVGVLVDDIQQAATDYHSVLGLTMSPARNVHFNYASGHRVVRATARVGTLRQNGVAIKLIEPGDDSPLSRLVSRHGNSAYHVGLCIKDDLFTTVERLERFGGRRIVGTQDDDYVHVDLSEQLGLVLELTRTSAAPIA